MKDRVLIIDYLNFVYRGVIKFGGKEEKSADEFDNKLVFNFFRNLRALIENLKPNKVFLALEGNPIFRKTLFPDYKKNRLIKTSSEKASTRDDVLRQANIICELVAHLPIVTIKADKYEADDTIFSLARNLQDEEVIIVSSDSDLIQILQRLPKFNIKLYNSGTKQFIEAPNYVYLVWKSLAGDGSDNIPSILSDEKSKHLASSPIDLKEFLNKEENRANFSLNRQLIELQIVPDNELKFIDYNINFNALFKAFEQMKFMSMLAEPYCTRFKETFGYVK